MPLLPREKIDDVRERTNIVDVVKRYVELKRAGAGSFKGLCPFHVEKTPSFHVHEQRQFFHCFGCGEKGDVFTFLVKIEQRSFMEVLRDLARQSGVDIPEKSMTPAERKAAEDALSDRERMLRAMEEATQFYQAQLAGPAGAAARAYIDGRGITKPVSERFRLGYAPGQGAALRHHLSSRQVPDELAERLGLLGRNERGHYDFFRDRVMLPVLDRQKRPIGFASRLLDPDAKERKYVNSPDSPLYHKKENLYGLHAAIDSIRRGGTAVVVEGNFDVLSLHEAGIDEAVAPMGTALTAEQILLLARAAKRIVVVFDGDAAGARAADKTVALAVEAGMFFAEADADGRIAELPSGVDPDEFVRAQGPEAFRALLAQARPMVDHLIQRAAEDPTVPGKAHTAKRVVEVLAQLRNPLVRDLYVRDLAAKLGVPVSQVARMVREAQNHGQRGAVEVAPVAQSVTRRLPADELEALALLVAQPTLASSGIAQETMSMLRDPALRQLYAFALDMLQVSGRVDVPACLDHGPAEIRQEVARALMDGRWEGVVAAEDAMHALLLKLQRSRVDSELADAQRQHREAMARGDEQEARAISIREMDLIRAKLGLANHDKGMAT
ncbi:MAG: DNA primase [Polyangia bacterium]